MADNGWGNVVIYLQGIIAKALGLLISENDSIRSLGLFESAKANAVFFEAMQVYAMLRDGSQARNLAAARVAAFRSKLAAASLLQSDGRFVA